MEFSLLESSDTGEKDVSLIPSLGLNDQEVSTLFYDSHVFNGDLWSSFTL